jgi:hypothetical protein
MTQAIKQSPNAPANSCSGIKQPDLGTFSHQLIRCHKTRQTCTNNPYPDGLSRTPGCNCVAPTLLGVSPFREGRKGCQSPQTSRSTLKKITTPQAPFPLLITRSFCSILTN